MAPGYAAGGAEAGERPADRARPGAWTHEDSIDRARRLFQYAAQRDALLRLRDDGTTSSDAMRRLEREVDLEESRLDA